MPLVATWQQLPDSDHQSNGADVYALSFQLEYVSIMPSLRRAVWRESSNIWTEREAGAALGPGANVGGETGSLLVSLMTLIITLFVPVGSQGINMHDSVGLDPENQQIFVRDEGRTTSEHAGTTNRQFFPHMKLCCRKLVYFVFFSNCCSNLIILRFDLK